MQKHFNLQKINKPVSLVILLTFSVFSLPGNTFAAPGTFTFNPIPAFQLLNDADGNGVANIGDTIRFEATVNNVEFANNDVVADTAKFRLAPLTPLVPVGTPDGTDDLYRVDITLENAGDSNGVDAPAGDDATRVSYVGSDIDDVVFGTSAPAVVALDTIAPGFVGVASVVAESDGSITLNWPDNSDTDLASYAIQRSTTSGSGFSDLATGIVPSQYNDSTTTDGVTYYYRVLAVDDAGNRSTYIAEPGATAQVVAQTSGGGGGAMSARSISDDVGNDADSVDESDDESESEDENMADTDKKQQLIDLLLDILRNPDYSYDQKKNAVGLIIMSMSMQGL